VVVSLLHTSFVLVEFYTGQSMLPSSVLEFEIFLKVQVAWSFSHSIVFARWRQQHKNGRVMLRFAMHF